MNPTTSSSTAAEVQRELSEQAVLDWLQRRGYTATHAALVAEVAHDGGPTEHRRVSTRSAGPVAGGGHTNTPAGLQAELAESLTEALAAYARLAGGDGVLALLDQCDVHLGRLYRHRSAEGEELARANLEERLHTAEEAHARLRRRERELEAQLKQTVAIIAERLQTLATSIDPMRKDILLPLLRTVAVLGPSASVRAAARHMMFALYKRPAMEHRMSIVQEWLRVAQEAPARSLEQELIPELYTHVNAPVSERRLLALDCAAAVAPLLRHSPQVRYSLCQGLLRPLCEDDTSAVRRELPRCLSLLWGDATAAAAAPGASPPGASAPYGGGVPPPDSSRTTTTTTSSAAAAASDTPSSAPAASLSPAQRTFVMELLVHLATDGNSRSVRLAAQTQLCEVLYPIFLRDGVLLAQFVPLLLTVIESEATQLLLLRGTHRGRGATEESSASVAAAVALSNIMTLIQLLHAALRCVAAEVLHSRESADHRDDSAARGGDALTAAASLTSTYVHVVLPTAYNVLSPLLSKVRIASAATAGDAGALSDPIDPSTKLGGPLCALCATLASLVPLLGAQAWREVAPFLLTVSDCDDLLGAGGPPARAAAATPSAPAPAPAASLPKSGSSASLFPQDFERGRLLFVFSFFLFLCGDAATLPAATATAAASAAADDATRQTRVVEVVNTRASPLPSPPSASLPCSPSPPTHIRKESLRIMAQCISFDGAALGGPRPPPLHACVQCVAALAPFAAESYEMAAGITSLVDFLVRSPDVRQRLTAVALAHDACAALASDRLKVSLLVEPLLPLLKDAQPAVQEAALRGLLSLSIALTEPRAQEKTIRPVLRAADAAGCTSPFTRCLLEHCDHLMQRMPAEPREALLYPHLAALMDRLAEAYVEKLSQEVCAPPPPPPASSSSFSAPAAALATAGGGNSFAGVGTAAEGQLTEWIHEWGDTMLVLQALLSSIVRCAVVTPTLVYRYLLPGLQQLSSDGILTSCSPAVRSRWLRLHKTYIAFMESNSASRLSGSGAVGGNPTAGTLLDRFKDELKRRL
ncbi:hypothetical protein NESM_000314500 [Novymonas esmeraldas]|uniref:LisH domain-containing protein n=1 Tax=Novymonas esmeraldas TaxID=1808958 RepID=A0AAW0ELJ9_9TRYP